MYLSTRKKTASVLSIIYSCNKNEYARLNVQFFLHCVLLVVDFASWYTLCLYVYVIFVICTLK